MTTTIGIAVPLSEFDEYYLDKTVVVSIPVSSMTLPEADITGIIVTFIASADGNLSIGKAYVGENQSGDAYDFSSPAALLFDGDNDIDIPAGGQQASDITAFAYSKQDPLVIAYYIVEGDAQNSVTAVTTSYSKTGDDAVTTNKTGYSVTDDNCVGIAKVEFIYEATLETPEPKNRWEIIAPSRTFNILG